MMRGVDRRSIAMSSRHADGPAVKPSMTQPVFRFAPSPNGYLHLGHALSALLNFDMARAAGGRLPAAHRGHRRGALPAGIRGGDLRGSRLARHRVGAAGAAAIRAFRRLSRGAGEARSAWACLSELREPRRDRAPGRASATCADAGRAIPTARRFIPARREQMPRAERDGAHRARRALCAAARHGRRRWRAPARCTWSETGAGPPARPATSSPSRRPGATSCSARKDTPTSYHLSVVVDDALQGVTACGARAGPVLVDQRAPRAAGAARPAGAALSPSPADPRRRRPQAVEIDAGHGPARTARAGRDAGRHPPTGRARHCSRGAVPACHACWPGAGGLDGRKPRRKVARQGAQAPRRAARAPRAIEAALAGLAHDIRTPLTGILALARIARAPPICRERERRWAEAIKSARRASGRADHPGGRCGQGRRRGLVLRRRAVLAARAGRMRSAGSLARARRGQGARRSRSTSPTTCRDRVSGDAVRLRARWKTWSTTR